eukprot:CAMPEP_0175085230 /NCGR_PEP_ID=MMETSP0052_2-20121109/28537_1 /TAXON_ID=51329 ORGANISM="Polytomella parva, Strain SAG 63-3" /NCGR_SAMPLE_ID=MMETSP0052_2 /ASSEMBLY_ACC=CAM_ASM_000194 /LENGTH=286 /DNA_ID=CAMNT_0016357197 /DNA_START=160 /DNA_END=1020 /DNA_ORIENTATION=-
MQIFVKDLSSKTHICNVETTWSGDELVDFVQDRLGISLNCPIVVSHGSHRICNTDLIASFLTPDSTCFVSARLPGGKGGFGALLRINGRDGKKTTNFSACRDLQGRRLRAVESEAKLREWEAQAEDRELELLATKHLKECQRQAKRESREQVDVNSITEAQEAAVGRVKDALNDVLACGTSSLRSSKGPVKRIASTTEGMGTRGSKKAKFIQDFSEDDDSLSTSEEEEEEEEEGEDSEEGKEKEEKGVAKREEQGDEEETEERNGEKEKRERKSKEDSEPGNEREK